MKLVIEIPDSIANRNPHIDQPEKRAQIAVMVAFGLMQSAHECLTLLDAWDLRSGTKEWESWVNEVRAMAAREAQEAESGWLAHSEAGQEKRQRAKRGAGEARP
jgi:hypothetical protein